MPGGDTDAMTFVCATCDPSRQKRQYEIRRLSRACNDGLISSTGFVKFIDARVSDPQEYADLSAYFGRVLPMQSFKLSLGEGAFDGLVAVLDDKRYQVVMDKLVEV
jgi:hypothetical protein